MRRFAILTALFAFLVCGAAYAQTFDQYGGYTGLKGTNTSGFFRAEKINGRYWLVTPENNVFWSTGICVQQYNDTWGGYCPTLNYYPNPYSNKAKYAGGQTEWSQKMSQRMMDWGFNTAACWGVSTIANRVQCVRDLSLCGYVSGAGGRMVSADFPDVWDPKWDYVCNTQCKQMAATKDDPWIIGSFPYNELHWADPSGYACMPDAFIALPAAAYGKLHWVNDFLKSKYATITDLNTAWGTSYASFDDLLSVTSIADNSTYPARFNDKLDFMEDIADKFYSVCTYYMRLNDPNHIVFTTRWAMFYDGYASTYDRPFNERIWKKAGQYCDVFANNGYADFASAEQAYQHSSRVFQNAKKPFIITEHATLANDSYFANNTGWQPTQMDRGNWYYDQVKKLMDLSVADDPNDPGHPAKTCMGIHWFQCYDEPSLGRPDGEKAQFGVLNSQDEAFLPFVETAKSVNSQIYSYGVSNTAFDIPEAPTAASPLAAPLQQSEKASSFSRLYKAVDLSHGTGAAVDDAAATYGKAWAATAATHTATYMVYGPYAAGKTLWPGAQCTVKFRMKAAANTSSSAVATIDAFANPSVYTTKDIKGTDFSAANAYQEFSISFTTPTTLPDGWEFRVNFRKITDIYVDTIKVELQPKASYAVGPISDGSDTTVWSSAGYDAPSATEWAAVYLGATAVAVSDLSVITGAATAAGMPVDFQVQSSNDGAAWTAIPGQTYTNYPFRPGLHSLKFSPVSCKYLRLYATKLGQDSDGKYRMVLAGLDLTPKVNTATPTFTWSYSSQATSYTLLLSPVAHFPEEQTIRIAGITNKYYTPTVPLAQGTWYWTVKATNPAGHDGKYLKTVKCEIGNLPDSAYDLANALHCEQVSDWRNVGNSDTGGDGYSFAFLDDAIKTEGNNSLRVAITVNSLNKTTNLINQKTSDVPFRYAGHGLDCSGISSYSFSIYPKRFTDSSGAIVPSTKYVWFRMVDALGSVAADQAIDPNGTLAIGQWSTVNVSLTGRRCQISRIEFYVKSGATKLTWDERVFFNIDNLTLVPPADLTPPETPTVAVSGYTVNNTIWANILSTDPETGISEYLYAVGSTPGADDLVPWSSNGNSGSITVSGLSLTDGQACYVSAKTINGIGITSETGTSKAIRKVSLASDVSAAREQSLGSWVALERQVVVACFPGKFYAEREDRSSGIGVVSTDSVIIGDRVTVYGQTQLVGKELMVSGGAGDIVSGDPLEPVAMNQRSSGGAGVGRQASVVDDAATGKTAAGASSLGCLARLWGNATYVDPAGSYFYIDDGSGLSDGSGHKGIKVESPNMLQPVVGSFARVTGVLAAGDVAGNCARVLKPRTSADLTLADVDNYLLNGGWEAGVLSPWTVIGSAGEVKTGSYYFGIYAHSGSWFYGSYGRYAVNNGLIYQRATVNPGRSYIAGCYSGVLHGVNEADAAMSRIGIDPTGGTDPNAAGVVWSGWDMQEGLYVSEWRHISTPAVAVSGDKATVFLQYFQQDSTGYHINSFDDVVLSEQ